MSYVVHSTAALRRRRSSLLASLAAILAAGVSTAAIAQQSASPENVLPTIVVSPTGVPTPETNIASSVTVITGQDIEREQRRTISDVLANVPGLNIVQAGGPGKQTSIFMRGTESNHVKVLIDGIDAGNPGTPGGAFDFAHLLASDIERVEVLRGPQSGLYGANAIGGVISITTKRGSGPPKVAVTAEGGSFNTFNQYGSLSGSVGAFDYAFGVAHLRTDGTSNVPLYLQPLNRPRLTDKYENTTFSSKTGLQISDDFRVNSVLRYTDADLKFVQNPGELRSYQIVHHLFTRQEAVWSGFDGRFVNYFGVNYSDQWSSNRGPAATARASINRGERVKLDWRGVTTLLPGHILVTGVEHENEKAISRQPARTSFGENTNTAGYAELQSQFAERVFVTANVRQDENELFGGATTYRVAPAVLLPVTETKLKASYGTGFKAPSVDELFFSIPNFNFVANPNLRPERAEGWDAGFEQPVFDNRLRFGATYFHNDIIDLITFQQNPMNSTLINIDRAKTSGVETFVAVQPFRTFGIRGDYTYTKAIDARTDLELLRRPKNKASISFSWLPIDPLTLSLTVLHVGEWVDFSRAAPFVNRPIVPGYTVVNIAADYRLNEYAKVFARIDNLFNERYENPNGFERPGFAVYGGVRLTN
jgi:vitamin B12 transporter